MKDFNTILLNYIDSGKLLKMTYNLKFSYNRFEDLENRKDFIYSVVLKLLENKDQDRFISIYNDGTFDSFMYRIVKNHYINWLKSSDGIYEKKRKSIKQEIQLNCR